MIEVSWQLWTVFLGAVLFMLLLDLGVFHKEPKKVSVQEALGWTAFWIFISLVFNYWIFHQYGHQKGMEFLAGYILEKSLSVDNLFVFLLIFNYFKVPPKLQHRVLFFGIIGALVLRGVFISIGSAIIHQFHWVLYLFGAFLVFSGVKLLLHDDDDANPENAVVRAVRARVKLTEGFRGDNFFVVENGVKYATPLFLVLVAIETSDVLFAVDSIPAIFGVTEDPFIVFTSNVMAILGLRAIYFALAGLLEYFHYLNYGLSGVLIFIGAKMLGEHWFELSTPIELGVIAAMLSLSVVASILFPKTQTEEALDFEGTTTEPETELESPE